MKDAPLVRCSWSCRLVAVSGETLFFWLGGIRPLLGYCSWRVPDKCPGGTSLGRQREVEMTPVWQNPVSGGRKK